MGSVVLLERKTAFNIRGAAQPSEPRRCPLAVWMPIVFFLFSSSEPNAVFDFLQILSFFSFDYANCAMAQKRKLAEEFDSLGAATPTDSAIVHGVVSSLSPMKKGKTTDFFEAKLMDGELQMRVVGFQESLRERLAKSQEKEKSVSLQNCQVKHGRNSDELEIILKSSSRIQPSPKKIVVNEMLKRAENPQITLDALPMKSVYDKVTLNAKVINVEAPAKVSGGLTKQDVVIADSTSPARITLWERDIGQLTEGNSYRFTDIVVRMYQQEKYLSVPKDSATITEIEDIGEVAEDDLPEQFVTVYDCQVIGVKSLDSFAACLDCKCKVEPSTSNIGVCTKCNMQQRIDICQTQLSAKLYISSGTDYLTLHAFGTNVTDITQEAAVTVDSLMTAPPFTLTHENNIITSIRRP